MGPIQSSINSIIGSAHKAVLTVKAYKLMEEKKAAAAAKKPAREAKESAKNAQKGSGTSVQKMASDRAKQSAADAVEAKKQQRRDFMQYLSMQPSSLGTVGSLPQGIQKQIAGHYTPTQRKALMDRVDKEKANGKHR